LEAWQAWFLIFLFSFLFAKARLLLYDLRRRDEACNNFETFACKYYKGTVVLDGIYIVLLLLILMGVLFIG